MAGRRGRAIGIWFCGHVRRARGGRWSGWTIEREHRRRTSLRCTKLDFLGYSFEMQWVRYAKYREWKMCASRKSILRERERLREMTGPRHYAKPLPLLVDELNAHLRGWANYYRRGGDAARRVLMGINYYVNLRLYCHLRRRSQRPWRPPKGMSVHVCLTQQYGLIHL